MLDTVTGLRLTSKLSCSLFTGAAIYVNLVEHPSRQACNSKVALTQFKPSFNRAYKMQGLLGLIGSSTALVSYYLQNDKPWLYAGLLFGSVIPFTFIFITPVYTPLLKQDPETANEQTVRLLNKWNNLHAVRTVLSFAATFIMLYSGN